ncbi:MAG: leucine-rich repeat protein [Salinivirgaceae bacterium]|nr:leucine-rich repeat protein [Salinivirgaceae bacterium]
MNISAEPNFGYRFVKWSNGLINTNETIMITSDTIIVAEFEEKGFTVGLLYYDFTSDTTVEVIKSTDKEMTTAIIPETVEFDGKTYAVTSIGYSAFEDCGKLTSITISNSVKIIGSRAFYKCGKLSSITIPEQITTIGVSAFYACDELTSITIPKSVSEIEIWAFEECDKLTDINVDSDNMCYSSENGVLFNKDKTEIIRYPGGKAGSYTIPDGVTSIGISAFGSCRELTSIIISNTVMSIGNYAFDNSNITSIIIPNSVTKIGSDAFRYCGKLMKIIIPNSVITIYEEAFYGCYSATIYCESEEKPAGWSDKWNYNWSGNILVVWGTDMNSIFKATVTADNDAHGDVEGGGIVIGDSIVTITASPEEGYHFTNWSDNNTDNPRTLTITSDTSLTAFFEAHTVVTDSAVAATCTKPGLTEGKHCSVCNAVLDKQDTIPAKGHTIVIDAAVEPTCTETGLGEGKHCSACNEFLMTQELLPALGHEFVNYVYNNNATTEADGTETAVCENGCGETDTRVAEGTKLATTAVSESAANAVNIFAYGNTIVVENATDEIRVYDAMGTLVGRDVARNVCTIKINNSGVYIVKTGGVVKRVMVE